MESVSSTGVQNALTSISDAEVEYEDQAGHFWHLRYKTTDGTGYIDSGNDASGDIAW